MKGKKKGNSKPLKNYRYRVDPTKNKVKNLNQKLRICRWLYNFLCRSKAEVWERKQKMINYYEQQELLPILKEQFPFLKKVHSQIIQDVVDRVNVAWQPFYQQQKKITKLKTKISELTDVKKREKLKRILNKIRVIDYPREKKPNRYCSFTYTQNNSFELIKSQLKLERRKPLLINVIKHREIEGTPKTCSILVKNEKWYTTIACEMESKQKLDSKLISLDKQTGIDVGTSEDNFYVLENGYKCPNPQWFQTEEKNLSERLRKLDCKKHKRNKEGKTEASKNYRQGQLQFAKHAEKVSNRRLDFISKEVSKLKKSYDFFGVENFKASKIVEKAKIKNKWYSAKKMYDSSLSLFLKTLSDGVEATGQIEIKVSPAYTSQTCSKCWKKAPIKQELKDRVFICAYCKFKLDRDKNSACNILRKAQITEFGTDFVRQVQVSP